MTHLPTNPIEQIAILLSAASTARDQQTRTLYVAAARSLHSELATRAKQIDVTLVAMETELARSRIAQ